MKIKIDGRSFIYPDSDIDWFDSLGNVKYKLISRIVKSRPFKGDSLEPESWDNFNRSELNDRVVWVSKNRNSHDNNFEIHKKVENKKDMVKIKSGTRWYEYPEDQIESWDEDGNIKWSDLVHWKFTRNRPKKGDEFVYDEEKFLEVESNIKNKNKCRFNELFCNFLKIKKDSKISIVFPSKNILNRKYGKEIDSSDFIIRFNQSVLSGYEEFVGSKTNLLVSNFQTLKMINELEINRDFDKILIATPTDLNIIKNIKYIPDDRLQIDYDWLKSILENEYDFITKHPTAGFSLIILLVYFKYTNINLYGYENRRNGVYTYYYKDDKTIDEYQKESSWHEYMKESEIIIELEKIKSIKIK